MTMNINIQQIILNGKFERTRFVIVHKVENVLSFLLYAAMHHLTPVDES